MKKILILTYLLTVAFSGWSNNGHDINNNPVHVISMTSEMFHFKSHKALTGAQIDVYSYKTGEKVLSQVVTEKTTIVNLQMQEAGDYIILITKGDFKQKYVCHKTTPAPKIMLNAEALSAKL